MSLFEDLVTDEHGDPSLTSFGSFNKSPTRLMLLYQHNLPQFRNNCSQLALNTNAEEIFGSQPILSNAYLGSHPNYRRTASSATFMASSTAHSVMDATKRRPLQDSNNTPKKVKTEDPSQFSAAVKKKLQASSRTGQACDRCKVCYRTPQLRIIAKFGRRFERFDAMHYQEGAHHVSKQAQYVKLPIVQLGRHA